MTHSFTVSGSDVGLGSRFLAGSAASLPLGNFHLAREGRLAWAVAPLLMLKTTVSTGVLDAQGHKCARIDRQATRKGDR